jgi:DNA-binding MarR family transcriptional regulator
MEIQNVLGYLLNTSARFIKREMDKNLEAFNLTTSQWAILKLLDQKSELTQAQISNELKGDRATTGTVTLNLYEKGYINKVMDQKDRRSYIISLTQKAKEIISQIELIAEDITKTALKGVSEQDVTVLYDILNKIIINLSVEEDLKQNNQ